MKIKFKKTHKNAVAPIKGSKHAAAFDLVTIEDGAIIKGKCSSFRTGLSVAIPNGYIGLIWPRSGLAFNETVSVLGGCIDPDYRGEIKVGLTKHNDESITHIRKGDRIAQLLIIKNTEFDFEEIDKLEETERADKGFGSSGLSFEDLMK